MKKITLTLIGLICWLTATTGYADTPPTTLSPYTSLILKEWALKDQSARTGRPLLKHALLKNDRSETGIEAFIKLTGSEAIEELADQGIKINSRVGDFVTAFIPLDRLSQLAADPRIQYIEAAQPVRMQLDVVREKSKIQAVQNGLAPLTRPYTGEGIVIGVVDEGFDFTHPNFYDATGTNFRIQKVWVQKDIDGTPPEGYNYGTEYDTRTDILARQTDNIDETHGTHTAGIAAGSGYGTPYTGAAPASDLILVATTMQSTGILNGVQYIVSEAKAQNKPCVVNLSIGSQMGPHDGTSPFDQMIDQIAGPGTIVVGAAGNEGEEPLFLQKQYDNARPADTLLYTVLEPAENAQYIVTDMWGTPGTDYSARIEIIDTASGTVAASTEWVDQSSGSLGFPLYTPQHVYLVRFQQQLNPLNQKNNMLIFIQTETFGDREKIRLSLINKTGLVQMWATNGTFTDNNYGAPYTKGSTDYTVSEIGGVGRQIISVGAYCTKNKWTPLTGGEYSYNPLPQLGAIAPFSSKGPTADGRTKPDITAPGFGVVSSFNSYNPRYGATNGTTVQQAGFNNRTYFWGIDQGTSMAAPVVAGTMALWLEAYPQLSPAEAKDIFARYAQDPTGGNNIWGQGKLDAFSGIQEAIKMANLSGIQNTLSQFPVVVYPQPASDRLFVETNPDCTITRISIRDLSGRQMLQQDTHTPSGLYTVPVGHLPAGIYLLQAETNSGPVTQKILIR